VRGSFLCHNELQKALIGNAEPHLRFSIFRGFNLTRTRLDDYH
jgi:hypothetical protein